MKSILGNILKVLGYIIFIGFGLYGFVVELIIVNKLTGFWGIVIGITVLPATFLAVPWYALIKYGSWYLLLITYGAGIVASIIIGIGSYIKGD